jgi:hypothetical protein
VVNLRGETYQTDHFDAPPVKLAFQLRECPELGRAYRREVGWVGKQDCPAIADKFMEVNIPVCGLGFEIGS